jgi:RND family efflux transporter MFP subunit
MSTQSSPSFPARLLILALLPALGLGLASCDEAKSGAENGVAPARPSKPVLTATVKYEPLSPDRSFVAVIRPRIETDLGFRVPGKVARRMVDVGQPVKGGDALAELDETDLRLQREQAEADVRALATAVIQASAEEQRVQNLRKQGWSTDAALERARAVADDTRARKERADRALSLAENALGYAVLRADADGVVTAALVEPGQVVTAGQAAMRVARLSEKEAVIAVPESLVSRISSGKASLSLWADPDTPYAATLRELSPVADPATRTYAARYALPEAGEAVKLGMTATLTVADGHQDRAARLPLSALFNQGAGPSVWTVDPATGSLALKAVEVAGYGARDVLVRSGVADGDQVVALGVQKLDPASKVRVVSALGL